MLKNYLLKKSIVVSITIIFILSSLVSNISGISEETDQKVIDFTDDDELQKDDVLVTCSTFGIPGKPKHENSIPLNEAELLLDKIKELQIETSIDPYSDETRQLQKEIINTAKEHNLIPKSVSTNEILSRLTPKKKANYPLSPIPRAPGRASETFCNYVSWGTGSALPIIILPRLIPILLTPIPRLFVRWSTYEGMTSCGGLRSGKGFIASGAQNGIALGFWGIGFSIFLPPVMAYGILGYALYASVNAENITYWPPNYPPEITMISPPNGATNVPVSTSELSFQISDINKALMNYTVTTSPDVGSDSGSNLPDGTYTVPISGLEGSEEYTWYIQTDDGVNDVDVSSLFTTEPIAPIVSSPKPEDGKRYVSIDISQLSFYLSDPQGDLMDYTVETSPDVGSGGGTGVTQGTYNIDVSGLNHNDECTWYVNVTDGVNWKHKAFHFQIEPIMVFNPFDDGWQYRKKITINHTKVVGDLTGFPVLVSTVDSDLRFKAQNDGDDILFMDDDGVATRLFHEIEKFDGSTGELVAWVNISNLASDEDTFFYIYYNNENCDNQQTSEMVWDSNYIAVYHMNDIDDDIKDSTSNNNDGSKKGVNEPVQVEGFTGKCQQFDGNDDFVNYGNDQNIKTNLPVTISCFVNPNNYIFMSSPIFVNDKHETNGYHGVKLGVNPKLYPEKITLSFGDGGNADTGRRNKFGSTALTLNSWYQVVGIIRGSIDMDIFINGENDGGVYGGSGGDLKYSDSSGYIGQNGYSSKFFSGMIDEVRFSNIARSQNWVSTSFNNQNNPSSFVDIDPEETSP